MANTPKDTIQVPRNGYVILRSKLDNPGFWLFHCHIEAHLERGMGLVVQVGEQGDWTLGDKEHRLDLPCDVHHRSLSGPSLHYGQFISRKFPTMGDPWRSLSYERYTL